MCDSLSVQIFIDDDIDIDEYQLLNYPTKPLNDFVHGSGDFRTHTAVSPLTAAGFRITPFGQPIANSRIVGDRFKHGVIAGYQVDVNPPACMIGHNRQLEVSVNQGVAVAFWLLKYWLALNGCTEEGLRRIRLESSNLLSVTLTQLYPLDSEMQAREKLRDFRTHSEALLNKPGEKKIAYSFPPEPLDSESVYAYTSYINTRDFKLSAYVKVLNQPGSTLLPLDDAELELEVQKFAVRTLRTEIKTKPAWMKRNGLNVLSAWTGECRDKSHKTVFDLLRTTLRLDDNLRSKILKKTSVQGLKLSENQKKYLLYYLDGNMVREHRDFSVMENGKANKAFSAARLAVLDETGIDFKIDNAVRTKELSDGLRDLLVLQIGFSPAEYLAGYVFSRISLPFALKQLKAIVEVVLVSGSDSVPPAQCTTIYRGPTPRPRKRRMIGISDAPLDENGDNQ